MNEQTLEAQFTEAAASQSVAQLIEHLTNANERLPAFALPDTIDAIHVLGEICRTHTNASDELLEQSMQLISAALMNALTNHKFTIISEGDDDVQS